MEKISKEWIYALQAYERLPEAEKATPKGLKLMVDAHRHSPEELKKQMRPGLFALINEFCAYLPKPTHCDGEGYTVHTTEDIARITGLTVDDTQFLLDEVAQAFPDDVVKEVHRVH
ncbi:hypothetical protein [Geotalea sp. SG265]|uniref:hypothetical protein n=1 Tax=Geotalea sp. SG265 TaxID=2922867 RepID=UPI001FAFD916|nr:hypothetical protein [Geotalea sp. SG265]